MANNIYDDKAVFLPSRGYVLFGKVGLGMPSMAAVREWLDSEKTGVIPVDPTSAEGYEPIGYTSVDELPKIDSELEGGELKGVWEADGIRQTAVTITESIVVTPVQWTEEAISHRFGKGAVDRVTGVYTMPSNYISTELAMLLIIVDGAEALIMQFDKVASSPEGGIEADPENFLGMPIKYTVLSTAGKPRGRIMLEALRTEEPAPSGADTSGTDTSGTDTSGTGTASEPIQEQTVIPEEGQIAA